MKPVVIGTIALWAVIAGALIAGSRRPNKLRTRP
jgi:hypothetical protein